MNVCMDGWMGMNEWMVNGRMNRSMNEWMDWGWMDVWMMYAWMDECGDGWMHRWMDRNG